MKFEPVTEFYAECKETGYRIIKHCPLGVVEYAAWHPKDKFIKYRLSSSREAIAVCREHAANQK